MGLSASDFWKGECRVGVVLFYPSINCGLLRGVDWKWEIAFG